MAGKKPATADHPLRTTQLADYSGTSHQQWPEPQHVHYTEDQPVGSHHEIHSDDDVPALVSVDAQAQHTPLQEICEHRPEFDDHHPAEIAVNVPIMSAVPQYVRGEEHVSTFIPPLPHGPVPISYGQHHHCAGQPEVQDESGNQQQPEHDTESHFQPQPVEVSPPVVEEYHRPPSPEPEIQTFEAPKAEWDASR